jgi:zinc transport system ATP-binding protein
VPAWHLQKPMKHQADSERTGATASETTVNPHVKQIRGEPIISVSNLSIEIGGRCIIRDANFTIPRGSGLAVIGPNGSGKTVLLKALLGLLPSTGVIRWAHGSRQGYIPQKVSADPNLPIRVREILKAKAFVQKLTAGNVEEAVAWAAIGGLLEQRLGALSSGQLQRVLLAMAMMGAPDVLLVDEPTASLDEGSEEHVFQLLETTRKSRATTIIIVSHDLALVGHLATHVICVNAGVASFGTARNMLRQDVLESSFGAPLRFHSHNLENKP